jgi:hypothetical protein
LKRELEARRLSANALAIALRTPSGRITEILKGKLSDQRREPAPVCSARSLSVHPGPFRKAAVAKCSSRAMARIDWLLETAKQVRRVRNGPDT